MLFLHRAVPSVLLLVANAAQVHSYWGFDEGVVAVSSKGGAVREKFSQKSLPSKPLELGPTDTLKVLLTAKENGKEQRPHQAFLILLEPDSGLEAPFPFSVKAKGQAILDLKHIDLPVQHLTAKKPLRASVILASFGSSKGYTGQAFDVQIKQDQSAKQATYEKPLRYRKLAEIHHIFKPEMKSPYPVLSWSFTLAVFSTVPALYIGWFLLGGNLSHLPKALLASPLAHLVFFGSITALEAVFVQYYYSWRLFDVLPAAAALSAATFLSGTKALGEVQRRRLAGER